MLSNLQSILSGNGFASSYWISKKNTVILVRNSDQHILEEQIYLIEDLGFRLGSHVCSFGNIGCTYFWATLLGEPVLTEAPVVLRGILSTFRDSGGGVEFCDGLLNAKTEDMSKLVQFTEDMRGVRHKLSHEGIRPISYDNIGSRLWTVCAKFEIVRA